MSSPFAEFENSAMEGVGRWSARTAEEVERSRELAERTAALRVSASGADGAIEVTVAASGALTDLRLDERVRQWPAERIAARIMAVTRRAQGMLAERVAELAADTIGARTETARSIVDGYRNRFPPQPEEEADAPAEAEADGRGAHRRRPGRGQGSYGQGPHEDPYGWMRGR